MKVHLRLKEFIELVLSFSTLLDFDCCSIKLRFFATTRKAKRSGNINRINGIGYIGDNRSTKMFSVKPEIKPKFVRAIGGNLWAISSIKKFCTRLETENKDPGVTILLHYNKQEIYCQKLYGRSETTATLVVVNIRVPKCFPRTYMMICIVIRAFVYPDIDFLWFLQNRAHCLPLPWDRANSR